MRSGQEIVQAIRAITNIQVDALNGIKSSDTLQFGFLVGRLHALNWVTNARDHTAGEILIDRDYDDHRRECRIRIEDLIAEQDDADDNQN